MRSPMRRLGHPPAIFCMTPLRQAKGSTPFRWQVRWQVSMMEVIAAARSPPAVEPVKSQVRRKMATPRSARSAIRLSISRRPSSQYLASAGQRLSASVMATASVLFADSCARIASMRAFGASRYGFACACRAARLVPGGCPRPSSSTLERRAIRSSSSVVTAVGLFSCRSKILRRACPQQATSTIRPVR